MCNPRQAYRTFKHKSFWGHGPWVAELDKTVWEDEATGLDCMVRRCKDGGYLCGYVAVEPGHPLFGFHHDAIPSALGIGAHRGIVESGLCDAGEESTVMCHIPGDGRPEDVWWFGFKCDEPGDYLPNRTGTNRSNMGDEVYRTVEYVQAECEYLAKQLAALSPIAVLPKPTITFVTMPEAALNR